MMIAGCDLGAHAAEGAVFAGYHYDFNFLTVHGRARYPALCAWLRNGTRVPVRVPEGCLLLQAGRELAWLTGGDILEGMHEVVCGADTLAAVQRARAAGRPLWRVSSTVFAHIGLEVELRPIAGNTDAAAQEQYPPTQTAEYVQAELQHIKLAKQQAAA